MIFGFVRACVAVCGKKKEDWWQKIGKFISPLKLQGPTGAAGLGEDAESSVSSSVGPENRRPFVSERLA